MKILIDNNQKTHPVPIDQLSQVAQKILSDLGCPEAELSISIVSDAEIRQINRDYLQRDKSTNVISFSQQEGEPLPGQSEMLGDVIISADTADRDAREAGESFLGELYFLLIHGILHLCGYDHERGTQEQAQLMEQKEAELFASVRKEFALP